MERQYYRKGNIVVIRYGSKHANVTDISLGRDAEWETFPTKAKENWLRKGYIQLTEEEAIALLAQNEILLGEEEIE